MMHKEVIVAQSNETIPLIVWNELSKNVQLKTKDKVYFNNILVKDYKSNLNLTYNEN